MRFMVIVQASEETDTGVRPDVRVVGEMGTFQRELVKAGVVVAAEGLLASSTGARITFSRGRATVIEGPLPELKELFAGFWLWEVRSKEEAIERVKRGPFQDAQIEIRQVIESGEFGEAVSPEPSARS